MASIHGDEEMTSGKNHEACDVFEKSPLKKGRGIHVHYGTIKDAENAPTAAKEIVCLPPCPFISQTSVANWTTQPNPDSSLPAQPRASFHAFLLNGYLFILSATLAFTVLVFEISVLVGYGDEKLRESRYLWAVNWFLVGWIGSQFCALSVHHWDCWANDKRCRRVEEGLEVA